MPGGAKVARERGSIKEVEARRCADLLRCLVHMSGGERPEAWCQHVLERHELSSCHVHLQAAFWERKSSGAKNVTPPTAPAEHGQARVLSNNFLLL